MIKETRQLISRIAHFGFVTMVMFISLLQEVVVKDCIHDDD